MTFDGSWMNKWPLTDHGWINDMWLIMDEWMTFEWSWMNEWPLGDHGWMNDLWLIMDEWIQIYYFPCKSELRNYKADNERNCQFLIKKPDYYYQHCYSRS